MSIDELFEVKIDAYQKKTLLGTLMIMMRLIYMDITISVYYIGF